MSFDKATYMKEYNKKYYKKNKEKIVAYREKNKEKSAINKKKYHLRVNFNLTYEEYNNMLKEQSNKCKICKTIFSKTEYKTLPCVDHCHTTDKVRGLLCVNCNSGIGMLKDSTNLLKKAINYLEEAA